MSKKSENRDAIRVSEISDEITNLTVNGVQLADSTSFVELNIDKLRKELTVHSEYINDLLERKIQEVSSKYNNEFTIKDLSTLRFYVKLLETYSDRPDAQLANILCDMLATSLPTEQGSILRVSLFEAIDTARLLNHSQLNLLAFIFLLRNCVCENIDTWGSFETFVKNILWKFCPEGLESQVLPKHLEFSKCTTFVSREMLISRMLTNSYLPAITSHTNDTLSVLEIISSCNECLNTNAIPEASRLSRQVFDLYKLDRTLAPNSEKMGHYNTRKGNDEHRDSEKKVIDLILSCKNGERTYIEWATSPIKNHVLTPVGMVLAISFIRNELGCDLDYSKWIY